MAKTLLPFVYQTRTLQRVARLALPAFSTPTQTQSPVSHPRIQQRRRFASRGNEDIPDNIPFEWDSGSSHIVSEQEALDAANREREAAEVSTITPSEQRIFRRLFEDVAKRSGRPKPPADDAPPGAAPDVVPEWMAKYPASLRESARLALGAYRDEAFAPGSTTAAAAAAAAAVATQNEVESEDPQRQQLLQEQQDAREEFTKRIESLFGECETDRQAWQVLEREVFSLVERFGLGKGLDAPGAGAGANTDTDTDNTQVDRLDLETYGPAYSTLLLSGLRALDGQFARPSPLVHRVLPRVRELGLASYVLGASTAFYNELIEIVWRVRGDAKGVVSLLREMQYAGLTPDRHTLRVVHRIEEVLDSMAEGGNGEATSGSAGSTEESGWGKIGSIIAQTNQYGLHVRADLGELANKIEPAVKRAETEAAG